MSDQARVPPEASRRLSCHPLTSGPGRADCIGYKVISPQDSRGPGAAGSGPGAFWTTPPGDPITPISPQHSLPQNPGG